MLQEPAWRNLARSRKPNQLRPLSLPHIDVPLLSCVPFLFPPFLEFIIALQKAFSSSSFSDENTNSVEDYLSGKANLEDRIDLPTIAYGLPDEVGKAMLMDPEKNRLWETDIGVVYGNIRFCEGALSQKPEKGAQEGMSQ